jgi:DNA-binding Lrp family transcriptional regulator
VDNLTFPKVSFFDVSSKIPVRKSADIEINLKKIDLKIMQYMAQGHGRDSFFEISKSLNLPYDSVHYHGKRLLKAGYFQAVVAQPGTNLFTLQTTCLLIKCKDLSYSKALFDSLKRTRYVLSDAIGGNVIMVHFLSPDHKVYRESLSRILGLVGLENIKNVFVLHWDKVILNNRYPLEFLL